MIEIDDRGVEYYWERCFDDLYPDKIPKHWVINDCSENMSYINTAYPTYISRRYLISVNGTYWGYISEGVS
jgi:hypothetical protein